MPEASNNQFIIGSSFRPGAQRWHTCVGHAILTPDMLYLVIVRSQFQSMFKSAGVLSLILEPYKLLLPPGVDHDEAFRGLRRQTRDYAHDDVFACRTSQVPESITSMWPKNTRLKDVICIMRDSVDQIDYSLLGGMKIWVGRKVFKVTPKPGNGKASLEKLRQWEWPVGS